MVSVRTDGRLRELPVRSCCLILVVATVLSGCATVDFDYPRSENRALTDTGDTRVGRTIEPLTAAHPGESGFLLQSDGIDALATRIVLAERAERSIDTQYYLITNDVTGRLFVESLLRAAERGVRVRLLLDDIQTQGYDVGLSALDSHPNFEVRIFNPFARGAFRRLNAVSDARRVNRRMHNKTFTIDNQVTIVGGRNIAAEYFAARPDVNFGDLDVVGVGPVVQDVSRQFDTYWNDEYAVPLPAFVDPPDDPERELAQGRARLAQSREEAKNTPYGDALVRSIGFIDDVDKDDFTWARYELVYDSPAKARAAELEEDESILTPLRGAIADARSEFVLLSPYFVPRKTGVEALAQVAARGVDVKVITNSLASTNHAIVHTGYAPYRKPLLQHGVKLYEVRADATVTGADTWKGGRASAGTLHTKSFLIDRKVLFLGSFNWDPRSAFINTELGVIIHSPELARFVAEAVERNLETRTYEVVLGANGRLGWLGHVDGRETVLTTEPDTSWWDRFSVKMMRILPIEGQL